MFKNLKQMNFLISEIRKLTNDPNSLKDPQAIMDSMGINQEELEQQLSGILTKKATLKFTKIHEDAVSPKYNYESDSGFDLHSTEDVTVEGMGRALAPTGLRFDIPMGHEIQVRPKSGLAINYGVTVLNTPSTIDGGYVGEVKVILFNTSREEFHIKKGTKVAQAVLCPVIQGKYVNIENIDELPETDRGDNGFGSTGIQL
jgi:dUTP pyrophosphatase